MSEFSDSLHLRTNHGRDVEALLRRAKVRGIILAVEELFVTFVVAYEDQPTLIEHNTGLLVHYQFSDDYGCQVDVYNGMERLAQLVYADEQAGGDIPAEEPQDRGEALDALLRAGLIGSATVPVLQTLDQQRPRQEWGSAVAGILGLGPVKWLSWDGVTHNMEHTLERFPAARIVGVS